jgi:hypothetical protein
MRLTMLAAVLSLSLQTGFAAVPRSVSQPAVPASISQRADSTAASPAKNAAHGKRKGTIGFISGLLLGPVGLGGVFLFTHNRTQRKAAKKGCVIFATVVVAAALCWLIVLGAKDVGGSAAVGSSRSGGSGGGSSGHSSSNNWSNFSFPNTGSGPAPKKKPVPAQPPIDWPRTMFWMY